MLVVIGVVGVVLSIGVVAITSAAQKERRLSPVRAAVDGLRQAATDGARRWGSDQSGAVQMIKAAIERCAAAIATAICEKRITAAEAADLTLKASRNLREGIGVGAVQGRLTRSDAERMLTLIKQ